MQISGQIDLSVPPARAIAALHDRNTLERFLLGTSQLEETGPAQFSFAIRRKISLMTLNLPGTLSVTPVEEGRVYRFAADAAHTVGGSVKLSLDMTFEPAPVGTYLSWAGSVESTGFAKAVLREKEDRIGTIVSNMMAEMKNRLQKEQQLAARQARINAATPANRG